jgi:deoxyribodipyrimidine photolyase
MTHALWLRGDLRLHDHAGFVAMAAENEPFVVFFDLDPRMDSTDIDFEEYKVRVLSNEN